ncbi:MULTISPECIES: response regulator [Asticcacaulis]|uniref:response regulator transcription factor n=1 Tax=Asticcacaulis TaxID=76890 RepID=UPI001AEAFA16|nr:MULTISPECIES: response regulator transcription factor [Asticcacaulis]MBP2158277.1 two-component system response regulator DesR [Asticcacaulis solisilvae]MDR6799322.1 two-component system response regulator DesR [Asticcacaulis sp. BE141]
MIRILVVEDQAMILGAIAGLLSLEKDFIVVGTAASGRAALDMMAACQPDIVVSDIEMSDMGGIDLALNLQAGAHRAKVLIVTTFARPGYLQRALAAGARGYLLKDTPSQELARSIRRIMAGERVIDGQLQDLAQPDLTDPLNDREREVLRLAEVGHSTKSIARLMNRAPGTVRNELSEAMQKLNAANRIEACRTARQMGWL